MGFLGTALRGLAGVSDERKSWFPAWAYQLMDGTTGGGAPMSPETAVGLPAWLSVVNRLSGGLAMCPLIVYDGPREARRRATDSWQWELLHDRPGDGRTPSAFRADIAASLAANGNAYLMKIKTRGEVRELLVLDPRAVTPERQGGRIVYQDASGNDGRTVTRTHRDIIHIRGAAMPGQLAAPSPLTALRQSLNTGLRRQKWEAAYFANDARPGIAIKAAEKMTKDQLEEWLDLWNNRHQGPDNAGKAAGFGGGMDLMVIPPISLVDAQFIESERLTAATMAGFYGVPLSIMNMADSKDPEADSVQFVTWGLGPMFTALEDALRMDEDLFARRTQMLVETLPDALLRTTTKNRYEAYRLGRQGGWMSVNEPRIRENLPAVEGGDTVQLTPVGGAVDRTSPNDTAPVPGADEETDNA